MDGELTLAVCRVPAWRYQTSRKKGQRGGQRGSLGTARPQVGTQPPCDHAGLLAVSWLSLEPLGHGPYVAVNAYSILSTVPVAMHAKATSVEGMW